MAPGSDVDLQLYPMGNRSVALRSAWRLGDHTGRIEYTRTAAVGPAFCVHCTVQYLTLLQIDLLLVRPSKGGGWVYVTCIGGINLSTVKFRLVPLHLLIRSEDYCRIIP